jgi:hypothetical protein
MKKSFIELTPGANFMKIFGVKSFTLGTSHTISESYKIMFALTKEPSLQKGRFNFLYVRLQWLLLGMCEICAK